MQVSFKDMFIVCNLGNELIICSYRLHTKSIPLENIRKSKVLWSFQGVSFLWYFGYLSGRRFQNVKVTVQSLSYKEIDVT